MTLAADRVDINILNQMELDKSLIFQKRAVQSCSDWSPGCWEDCIAENNNCKKMTSFKEGKFEVTNATLGVDIVNADFD